MYYTIYKITNSINDKYYIGKHKTQDPNDDYLGSGKVIRAAINKYGRDKFTKTILELCDSEEHMNERERAILTLEHVNNPNCYNCRVGGEGGWGHWLNSEEAHQSRLKGGRNSGVRERNLALTKEQCMTRYENGLKKWIKANGYVRNDKAWTEERRQLASKLLKEKNPMHNKCWVCSPEGEIKFIDKDQLKSYKDIGWMKGKRVKDTSKGSYDRCWINKDGVCKYIKNDDLLLWIDQGWAKGRILAKNYLTPYIPKKKNP